MLRIGFPSSAKFNKKKAEASANVERMTEAITVIVGARLRPAYELIEEDGDAEAPEKPAESERGREDRPDQGQLRRHRGGPR